MNTLNILFLSAVPAGAAPLELNAEYHQIDDAHEDSIHVRRFRLFRHARIQRQELERTLQTMKPDIVHFAGHGTPSGSLLLEAGDQARWELDRETLRTIFAAYGQSVKLAVLNACHSEVTANVLREVVPYVLGNAIAVFDSAALAFSQAFYTKLFAGDSLREAFRFACQEVGKVDPARALTPQLITTPNYPDPRDVYPLLHWLGGSGREESGSTQDSGSPKKPSLPSLAPGQEPTRAEVRMQLDTHLLTADDFDAFVIEAFPYTHRRFGGGMERVAKTNLLLQLHTPQEIWQALDAFLKTRPR